MKGYPLHWPEGWPRTPSYRRKSGRFRTTLGRARAELTEELERLRARSVALSTDIPLRNDGHFRAGARAPDDPGIAVYFQWKGKPYVIACDTYEGIEANVRAVHKTVEAMRTIERHGATSLLERAVSGFQALPPGDGEPVEPEVPWWETFNVNELAGVSINEIAVDPKHPMRGPLLKLVEIRYRVLIREAHPDRSDDDGKQARELNLALAAARAALEPERKERVS